MRFRKLFPAALCVVFILLTACSPAEDRNLLQINGVKQLYVSGSYMFTDLDGTLYQVSETDGLPVCMLENVVSFGSFGNFNWAITADGALYTWGENNYGELGNGTLEDSATPQKILENVAAAGTHYDYVSWALTNTGDLYTWGDSCAGQLGYILQGKGLFDRMPQPTPKKILENVVFYENRLAVTNDGGLYHWGFDITSPMAEQENGDPYLFTPKRMADDVEKIYRFGSYLYVLKRDGSLHTWTNYNAYPYADGPEPEFNTQESHLVKVLDNVKHMDGWSYGSGGYLALLENGDVYTWGVSNGNDCIPGFGTQGEARRMAKKFSGAKEAYLPGFALTETGDLYGWGVALGDRFCDDPPKNNGEPALILSHVREFYPGDQGDFIAVMEDGALYVRDSAAPASAELPSPVRLLEKVSYVSTDMDILSAEITQNGTLYRLRKVDGVTKAETVLENVTAFDGSSERFLAISGKYLMLGDVTYHEVDGSITQQLEPPRKIAVLTGR